MHVAVRLTLLVVLIAGAFGLAVHHGATYDENWPHPSGDQLEGNVDAYIGEQILLFGEVHSTEPDAITIHVTNDADEVVLELEVYGVEESVEPGGIVQVYGVLEGDRTMTPEETVVVDSSQTATMYKYVVSALGGVFAVGYFFRHWRVNARTLAFEPRNSGVNDDG